MKNIAFSLTLLALIMLTSSCNKSLSDIGYDQFGKNTSAYTYSAPHIYTHTETKPTHPAFVSYNFTSLAFMGKQNVLDFYNRYTAYRISIIQDMLGQMNTTDFYKPAFDEEYLKLCAPEILTAMRQHATNSKAHALAGWQILKPTPRIDNKKTNYTVQYLGDDWFEAIAADRSSVKIHMIGVGKNLNPVIVGIENSAENIQIDSKAKKLKGSYTPLAYINIESNNTDLFAGFDQVKRRQDIESIGNYIYKLTKTRAGNNGNAIHSSDILAAAETVDNSSKQFITDFYNDLTNKSLGQSRLTHKYKASCSNKVWNTITSNNLNTKSTAGYWQYFLGNNQNASYTVSNSENDWYVISDASQKPFLMLQVRKARTTNNYIITQIKEV